MPAPGRRRLAAAVCTLLCALALPDCAAAGRSDHLYGPSGGTVAGLAGDGFAVLVSDRVVVDKAGYARRGAGRQAALLSGALVMASNGCAADADAVRAAMQALDAAHALEHGRPFGARAACHALSRALYAKRYFPYSCTHVLCGVGADGKGFVAAFDPIGSWSDSRAACNGAGRELIQPILDGVEAATPEEAEAILRKAFQRAASSMKGVGTELDVSVVRRERGVSESEG